MKEFFVCDEMRMKRQQKKCSSIRLLLEVTGCDQEEEDFR